MPSSLQDPYAILGLDHDASPKQIKLAYRKLALQYHPDRQQQYQFDSRQQQEASNKFTEISGAYAILSDPTKKSQYDHLYKFGAFDGTSEIRDDDVDRCNYNTAYRSNANSNSTSGSGYKYTENMSGGYYTNKNSNTTSSTSNSAPSAAAKSPFFNYVGLKETDSFFDELLHTSKNNKATSSQNENEQPQTNRSFSNTADNSSNNSATNSKRRKRRPGIGFSLQSIGKHLSIHIPSKSEIMTSIASGEPLPNHNFGTRLTFSSSQRVSSSRRNHNSTNGTTTSLISTTTRIARGQQRTVTRTVCIQPDGRREEVIEENGEVKGRHVEEMCPPPPPSSSCTPGGTDAQQQTRGWQANQPAATSSSSCHSGIICGLRDCILGPCLGLQGV